MDKKIYQILLSSKKSGGAIYEFYISAALRNVTKVNQMIVVQDSHLWAIKKIFLIFSKLKSFSKTLKQESIVIRNLATLFFLTNQSKDMVVFHHYDPNVYPLHIRLFQIMMHRNFKKNVDQLHKIIVVSQYWKEYLIKEGVCPKKIDIIYNPFEIEHYGLKDEHMLNAFKEKYSLVDKPIIYIGNPQKIKGANIVYEALKELPVHLVTSGSGELSLPCRNLQLSFEEYLLLLQASSLVVLMSQFKEGWNRVAHEAMLSKTPVIGSGKGGMKELLEEGSQIVCTDTKALYPLAVDLLSNNQKRVDIANRGYLYAREFTLERFAKAWERSILTLETEGV